MHPSQSRRSSSVRSAFTLIELLVVIGVIAVVAGVIGIGFTGGGSAVAMQSGQSTLASLITGVRGKAAVANQNAAVVVWGDPTDADTFLRQLAVFVEVASGVWQQKGDAVLLPSGVFVVPPEASNTSTRAKLEPANADWFVVTNFEARSEAANPPATSTVDPLLPVREPGATVGSSNQPLYQLITLTPLGRKSGAPNRIVISMGDRESDSLIVFRQPESSVGITLSTYGIVTLINEKQAFKD
jgi:prepilin-type N-terminal cleavage/methylation domain-containing protein